MFGSESHGVGWFGSRLISYFVFIVELLFELFNNFVIHAAAIAPSLRYRRFIPGQNTSSFHFLSLKVVRTMEAEFFFNFFTNKQSSYITSYIISAHTYFSLFQKNSITPLTSYTTYEYNILIRNLPHSLDSKITWSMYPLVGFTVTRYTGL